MSNINDTLVPLDPSLYAITEDEARFLKECTGITNDEELKHHILTVQTEAYAVYPYSCIRRSKLPGNSAYPAVLNLGKTRDNAIMLDIGCGFGNDSRRAIADGFPLQNVLCSDLREGEINGLVYNHWIEEFIRSTFHAGFFNVGHKLFKTTPENYPLAFFEGDIFNTEFIFPETTSIPKLSVLNNLGQLRSQISIIHASAFFHLFEEEKQRNLARILAQLLSPQPGSIILGCQAGARTRTALAPRMFNPETWVDLWIGENGSFRQEDVEVHAYARPPTDDEIRATTRRTDGEYFWLTWSVVRK